MFCYLLVVHLEDDELADLLADILELNASPSFPPRMKTPSPSPSVASRRRHPETLIRAVDPSLGVARRWYPEVWTSWTYSSFPLCEACTGARSVCVSALPARVGMRRSAVRVDLTPSAVCCHDRSKFDLQEWGPCTAFPQQHLPGCAGRRSQPVCPSCPRR